MPAPARSCGDCSLCCKLLPVAEANKLAGHRCQHQRHSGCAIYQKRPMACALWNCRWLTGDDTESLSRPDRSRYVIDMLPDFIRITTDDGPVDMQTVQVWCDPAMPDAWRTPEMLAYIERRAHEGIATLIRFDSLQATVVFAPPLGQGQWREQTTRNNPELLQERKRRYGY